MNELLILHVSLALLPVPEEMDGDSMIVLPESSDEDRLGGRSRHGNGRDSHPPSDPNDMMVDGSDAEGEREEGGWSVPMMLTQAPYKWSQSQTQTQT